MSKIKNKQNKIGTLKISICAWRKNKIRVIELISNISLILIILVIGGFVFTKFYYEGRLAFNQDLSKDEQGLLINKSINKAIDFLYQSQLKYGEFNTFSCSNVLMENCYFDSSPFITTFVLYSLKDIKNEKTQIMIKRASNFLLDEKETGGIWRYWTSKNPKQIDPDLDVISTVSFILKIYDMPFENNTKLLLNNRNKDDIFFTWILEKKQKNDIDCVVNTNVLLYLGENIDSVCSYINDNLQQNESCSIYYPDKLTLYYVISRAFENNVTCFSESKNFIIPSILSKQKEDGSFGNDMQTALAINSLLNFNYYEKEVNKGIRYLLQSQLRNGSWKRNVFYIDPFNNNYFGSEELTTALVLEALKKYYHHFINHKSFLLENNQKTLHQIKPNQFLSEKWA